MRFEKVVQMYLTQDYKDIDGVVFADAWANKKDVITSFSLNIDDLIKKRRHPIDQKINLIWNN
ncbi:MAG: hypothetical protein JW802_01150 [Campylobacterales bacterium]|nr:hypothetical protein [Campylobacterales bacterium]